MPQYLLKVGKHCGNKVRPDGSVDTDHVYDANNPNNNIVPDEKVDLAATWPDKFAYLGRPLGDGTPDTPESLEAAAKDALAKAVRMRAEADAQKAKATAQTGTVTRPIDGMTPDELKKFIEDEEIDLGAFKPTAPGNAKKTHEERAAFVKAYLSGGK